jgi:hypothetical protein
MCSLKGRRPRRGVRLTLQRRQLMGRQLGGLARRRRGAGVVEQDLALVAFQTQLGEQRLAVGVMKKGPHVYNEALRLGRFSLVETLDRRKPTCSRRCSSSSQRPCGTPRLVLRSLNRPPGARVLGRLVPSIIRDGRIHEIRELTLVLAASRIGGLGRTQDQGTGQPCNSKKERRASDRVGRGWAFAARSVVKRTTVVDLTGQLSNLRKEALTLLERHRCPRRRERI